MLTAESAGNKTLILRRTIGLKKDEYQLDRKSTSKGEVMSVLESAGFSRSNPYYIVPQGRVTHLTNQKDLERLALLKEVAGTKVYEDRRGESMKIIEDTSTPLALIRRAQTDSRSFPQTRRRPRLGTRSSTSRSVWISLSRRKRT